MNDKNSRKGWDDVFFGALEKMATASGKIRDPQSAFDWFKGIREDLQDKIKEEITNKISKLDFSDIAKKVGDHLAENYRLQISVEWKPKRPHESKTDISDDHTD